MANYLIVCVEPNNNALIEKWLSSTDKANADLLKIDLHEGKWCYFLANCGTQDSFGENGIFKGYAIDHDSRRLIYSGSGVAPNVDNPVPGCYIRMQRHLDDLVVGNDLFGQLPIIYSFENGVTAISDSVFVLTQVRRLFGIQNRVNTDAALSRSWIHGMANQPLGTATLVDGIYCSPPGSRIHINIAGIKPVPRIQVQPAQELFPGDVYNYKEAILDGARKTASIVATVAGLPDVDVNIAVSGGLDSRICLAAGLICPNKEVFSFHTNKSVTDDFNVAKQLSERFNFSFTSEGKCKEQIPAWFLSCAGIYDSLIPAEDSAQNQQRVKLHGFGAEIYKGYYNWRPLSQITPAKVGYVSSIRESIATHMSSHCDSSQTLISKLKYALGLPKPKARTDISQAAYREASKGLDAIGIATKDPWATEWHYLYYNNPIHAGRTTMRSLLDIKPLMQHELVRLSRSNINHYPTPKQYSPSIVSDLLIVMDANLATIPFDDAKKNLPYDYVQERSRLLGHISAAPTYHIAGGPNSVNSGTPKFFSELIRSRGFHGNFSTASVKQLALDGYDLIPSEIRPAYSIPKLLVENELKRISSSCWYCRAAGKMMAFLLFT
ncbi:MAG: hypothetical protein KF778_06985 [Rhodocyclaceae bacterium]|nr:hypothetical protein [Rhodocyclaceae bacterium]MBX3668133.1 hypothetical protein [Rhodocyclaceae bacterium]